MSDEPKDEIEDDEIEDEDGEEIEDEPKRGSKDAKAELFEAIDHFKNAASILFERATTDPAVKSATKEAGVAVKSATKEAERVVRQIGHAAEPIAKQLTGELGRLTRDVMSVVEGKKKPSKKAKRPSDEEE